MQETVYPASKILVNGIYGIPFYQTKFSTGNAVFIMNSYLQWSCGNKLNSFGGTDNHAQKRLFAAQKAFVISHRGPE